MCYSIHGCSTTPWLRRIGLYDTPGCTRRYSNRAAPRLKTNLHVKTHLPVFLILQIVLTNYNSIQIKKSKNIIIYLLSIVYNHFSKVNASPVTEENKHSTHFNLWLYLINIDVEEKELINRILIYYITKASKLISEGFNLNFL